MNHQKLYLPVETLEHIICLIQDSDDVKERWKFEHRPTFLTCALVCNTWMALARRRLLSLYFPEGRVKITSEPGNLLNLVDVFQSPLCTLGPTFIRVLYCTSSRKSLREAGVDHELFFAVLPLLDASLFPSLQKLELEGPLFSNKMGRRFSVSPPSSVLSQIKLLILRPKDNHPSCKDIVRTIRLCPFIEEITLRPYDIDGMDYSLYQNLPPPMSLRKLVLDMQGLPEMTKWLMSCQPAHTTISSLTVCDVSWNDESRDIQTLLDHVGSNLEELVFDMRDWEEGGDFTVDDPDEPLSQFTENDLLKRLTIQGPPDVVVEIAPYLLKQAQFAPELEVLNITFRDCYSEEIPYLIKFKLLDEYARSRPSLRQIVISSTEVENWGEVKSYARKHMIHCEEKGILEFRPCSIESIVF